jgi:hypothetical protein
MSGRRMNWEKANRRESRMDSASTARSQAIQAERQIGVGMRTRWGGRVNLGWTPSSANFRLRAMGCWFNRGSRTLWAPREVLQQCRRIIAEETRNWIIEEHKEVT